MVGTPDVEMIPWPAEPGRLRAARARGAPRLILVAAGVTVPVMVDDELEDWVRLPSDDEEIALRAARLRDLARAASATARSAPTCDRGREVSRG